MARRVRFALSQHVHMSRVEKELQPGSPSCVEFAKRLVLLHRDARLKIPVVADGVEAVLPAEPCVQVGANQPCQHFPLRLVWPARETLNSPVQNNSVKQ